MSVEKDRTIDLCTETTCVARSLVDSVVNGNDQESYYPTTFSSWYSWLSSDFLPTVMSNKV